ncbi:hypothetical protein ACFXHD_09895, partial [Streptomyces hydrogenans]|uniref:hypothetical protein n=1 Tax=Streptomyces hydrogenans TaxID=1873719 RepID=UPI003680FCEC
SVAANILGAIDVQPGAFDMGTWYSPTGQALNLQPTTPVPDGVTLDVAAWAARVTGWTLTVGGCATKNGVTKHVSDVCRSALAIDEQSPDLFWMPNHRVLAALRTLAER